MRMCRAGVQPGLHMLDEYPTPFKIGVGDLILKVNRQPVSGQADFYRKVWALGNAGVKVPISILRQAEIKEITLNSIDRYQILTPKAGGEEKREIM